MDNNVNFIEQQKLDCDDITDIDVLTLLKIEMPAILNEEINHAILNHFEENK